MVNCGQPHMQANWRAQTIGWTLEPVDEDFIRKMIADDYAAEAGAVTYNGALVWADGAAIRQRPAPEVDR